MEDTDRVFENKLQKGRTGHFAEKYFRNKEHENGGPKHARTEENVTALGELVGVLSQEDQPQTHRSTRQMSRETGLTQSRVIQIIHRDLDLKCKLIFRLSTRLLPIIVSLSYIRISQGSVVTLLMRGGIFNNHFTANCPQGVPANEF